MSDDDDNGPQTITHITGNWFCVVGRYIQRCGVCGSVLIDTKNQAAPCKADGSPPDPPPMWPPGRQLRVTLGNPTAYTLLPEDIDRLETDSCFETIDLL